MILITFILAMLAHIAMVKNLSVKTSIIRGKIGEEKKRTENIPG